jgi:hypothetical protein
MGEGCGTEAEFASAPSASKEEITHRFFGLAIERRGLDSGLFHEQADWNTTQVSQLKQCCGTVGIPAFRFVRELQQLAVLLVAQGILFPFLRQFPIAGTRRFGEASIDSLDELAFLGRELVPLGWFRSNNAFSRNASSSSGPSCRTAFSNSGPLTSIVAIWAPLNGCAILRIPRS